MVLWLQRVSIRRKKLAAALLMLRMPQVKTSVDVNPMVTEFKASLNVGDRTKTLIVL